MANIPQFTAEENLIRVKMDKNTKYLIVEGSFDMPIYSEVIDLLIDKHKIDNRPVTLFGGGKPKILEWLDNDAPINAKIILDMDFDDPITELKRDYVTPLRKYSIENYFFDESVIIPLVAHLLSRSADDVKDELSINRLREHWLEELSELLPVVFYYQKIYSGDKEKWSTAYLTRDQGDWKICPVRTESFRNQLLEEMNIDFSICKAAFDAKYSSSWCPCVNFPGKMLMESFHRYLKRLCNREKDKSYSPVTSTKSLITQLSSRLVKNVELETVLIQALA